MDHEDTEEGGLTARMQNLCFDHSLPSAVGQIQARRTVRRHSGGPLQ